MAVLVRNFLCGVLGNGMMIGAGEGISVADI
jgi:hypothetical protein